MTMCLSEPDESKGLSAYPQITPMTQIPVRNPSIENRKSKVPCFSRSTSRCSSERMLNCVATGVGTRVGTCVSTSTST